MVCENGEREIRLCPDPKETFYISQARCIPNEEDHCFDEARPRRWNGGGIFDTERLPILLYHQRGRVTRSIASPSETVDVLKEMKCEKDPEGYIVPDPHHCNRYTFSMD